MPIVSVSPFLIFFLYTQKTKESFEAEKENQKLMFLLKRKTENGCLFFSLIRKWVIQQMFSNCREQHNQQICHTNLHR